MSTSNYTPNCWINFQHIQLYFLSQRCKISFSDFSNRFRRPSKGELDAAKVHEPSGEQVHQAVVQSLHRARERFLHKQHNRSSSTVLLISTYFNSFMKNIYFVKVLYQDFHNCACIVVVPISTNSYSEITLSLIKQDPLLVINSFLN